MRPYARILLYLLVTTVVVAGCSERPSPMAPVPTESFSTLGAASAGCPSVDDACDEIEFVVNQSCPADSTYEKKNAYKQCVWKTFNSALRQYKHCFSQEEKKLIRECVLGAVGTKKDEGTDPKIREEPHGPTN